MAFKPKTTSELFMAMQTMAEVQIDNKIGVIRLIEAEDDSGRNWKIELTTIVDVGGYGEVKNEKLPEFILFREG